MRSVGVWRCWGKAQYFKRLQDDRLPKGVGESRAIGSTPTVMNAIMDALWPLGVRNIQMPATPLRVWSAIQETRK